MNKLWCAGLGIPRVIMEMMPVILLLVISSSLHSQALACVDATLRDAAFIEPRDVHCLSVIGNMDDPEAQAIFDRLKEWSETGGKNFNVELVRAAIDDTSTRWEELGIPSAPPSAPVTVLAGTRYLEKKRFFIDYWEPAPSREALESMLMSPAREAIQRQAGESLAILLYIPAGDVPNQDVENILNSVVQTWSKREKLGIGIVKVARGDERERMILSFTAAEKIDADWVGVIFGRGKLMKPLIGEEITEAGINGYIEMLLEDCTCLRSPSSLGIDLPMAWDRALDETVVSLRGDGDETEMDNSIIGWKVGKTIFLTITVLIVGISVTTAVIVKYKNRG